MKQAELILNQTKPPSKRVNWVVHALYRTESPTNRAEPAAVDWNQVGQAGSCRRLGGSGRNYELRRWKTSRVRILSGKDKLGLEGKSGRVAKK